MSENDELNSILESNRILSDEPRPQNISAYGLSEAPPSKAPQPPPGTMVQWTTPDGKRFVGSGKTVGNLTPGLYEISAAEGLGLYFEQLPVRTEGLLRFPETNSNRVIEEIQRFWSKRDIFEEYGLIHKRGIVLWGPPGSGKSCTIQLLLSDIVQRGGVAIRFDHPMLFSAGMRILREIQRDTPVVVLMEDLDATLRRFDESTILNILDGVELVDRVVFLATTNYPELLGPRILNRPSRFDKRFKIGHPNIESRVMYLSHLASKGSAKVPVEAWAADTEGMSLAHLKELFVAVIILGDDYSNALTTLRSMKEIISSDERGKVGFEGMTKQARAVLGTTYVTR
jgi:hypothetical protein